MFIEHRINKCPKAPEGRQKPVSLQRSDMSVDGRYVPISVLQRSTMWIKRVTLVGGASCPDITSEQLGRG